MSRLAVAGTSSLLLLAHAGPAAAWLLPSARPALGVRDRLADQGAGIALTFDDGPHPHGTPAVLSALAESHAKATFFVVGEQVRRRPVLLAEIASAGHEVALHCDRHRNLLRLTPRQTREDLARGEAAIIDVLGYPPRLWRPPYGVL
ncbi:MAG: polysaccharide deacetylase family protein, partial [Thermoleophilaceae bacterium]